MTLHEIQIKVDELVGKAHAAYEEAESFLLKARGDAVLENDTEALPAILQSLSHLYVEMGALGKAEKAYIEREQRFPEPYVKLDFAMFYLDVLHEFRKAIEKVNEIPKNPQETGFDPSSVYSALNVKGRAFLRIGDSDQARKVLKALIKFVQTNPRPIFGYERLFINEMLERSLSPQLCREYVALINDRNYKRKPK